MTGKKSHMASSVQTVQPGPSIGPPSNSKNVGDNGTTDVATDKVKPSVSVAATLP